VPQTFTRDFSEFLHVGPPDLSPLTLQWHTNGGILVSYQVTGDYLTNSTTASLYWAKGTNVADILSGTSTNSIYSTNIPCGFFGTATKLVPRALLQNPPTNA